MATYDVKQGDNFSITVDLPDSIDDTGNADVLGVQISPQYGYSKLVSFDGVSYVPQLPKIIFGVRLLFLQNAPATAEFSEFDLGTTHNITIDDNQADVTLEGFQFGLQDFGEGIKGITVTPTFMYVGTRDPNCTT